LPNRHIDIRIAELGGAKIGETPLAGAACQCAGGAGDYSTIRPRVVKDKIVVDIRGAR
jgi:hypothetical protein